ncbi:MAG TPA: argininosuccinate lyase [Ktedonobacterales bacterium]|nr:argininosuccinate lyase [Ktedonobacterales bacterium]
MSSAKSPSSPSPAKLWSKGYEVAPLIERYEAGRNAALDAALARYDLYGSLAHARGLLAAGLLDADEWRAIHSALCALLDDALQGKLTPSVAQEDIHTLTENALIERIGDAGKKLHTGRSRNDQALVDLRLFAKDAVHDLAMTALDTAAALLDLAERYEWTPMPGYTHMQRAMLSSVGLWASAHAEALLDDCGPLAAAYALNDQCPLGSAAAYATALPLDRAYVARLLGFARPHHNVLTAANSRGKGEAAVVQALALIMLDLSKFAQDTLLFTTSEFAFFSAPQELCDGSSIMPQKRNLSALELVRARAQTVIALQGQMLATLAGLPSGYNMDYQETKAPLMEALDICRESLQVAGLYAARLHVNHERLEAACSAELFAADRANALAQAGTPFRDAYRLVAADPAAQATGDLTERLHARASEGAPGNLGLSQTRQLLAGERAAWQTRRERLDTALAALTDSNLTPMADTVAAATPSTPRTAAPTASAGIFDARPIVQGI